MIPTATDEDPLRALALGAARALCQTSAGRWTEDAPRPGLVVPGSFNPVHDGHWRLAQVAAEITGRDPAFELTIVNADKPPLTEMDARCRLAQFVGKAPIWLTRAATFVDKAGLFPGAIFVVGADTAARIVQPRFYGGDESALAEALRLLSARDCRFLVAGRLDPSGRFLTLDDLALPAAHRDLFAAIPASRFRLDISSTALRGAAP